MNKKVLLVASHGGHWVQMRKIAVAFDGMNVHYLSTTRDVESEISPAPLVTVKDANLTDKFGLVPMALKVLWIILKLRPDIILSTGAAPGFLLLLGGSCLVQRLSGLIVLLMLKNCQSLGKKFVRLLICG